MWLEKLSRLQKIWLLMIGVLIIFVLVMTGKLGGEKEVIKEQSLIANQELVILGTSDTVEGLETNQIYTNQGVFCVEEDIPWDTYLYQNVQAVTEERKIIHIEKLVREEIKLENCLIVENGEENITIFSEQYRIVLPCKGLKTKFKNEIADIILMNGNVIKISTKKEKISAKILAVRDSGIVLEGYGMIPMSDKFRFYETFGSYREKPAEHLVVGYEQAKFVVAEGELCAAVLEAPISVKKIRVLLKTTDYADVLHASVKVKAFGDYEISYGDQKIPFKNGEELQIDDSSEYLKNERMVFIPVSENAHMEIMSIERSCGTPSYAGNIEIFKETGGLVLVNEVDLETYLCGVVPSEMPASYEAEALKAQAVCARSYAYRQILLNGYAAYGAHVDDSVSYQVYNNLKEDEKVTNAVRDTAGKVLMFQNEVAVTYYFSTSCGYTTNETIWENGSLENHYISGKLLNDSKQQLDLTDEQAFRTFILGEEHSTYDSDEAWYRWEVTVPVEQMTENIHSIQEIGVVKDIQVIERNEGGVAQKVLVVGEKDSIEVSYEYAIRAALNGQGQPIHRTHGKDATGGSMLPSGFFVIDRVENEGKVTGFRIRGGGFGHGAGMSQNGANQMAKSGKSFKEILELFYEGTQLTDL